MSAHRCFAVALVLIAALSASAAPVTFYLSPTGNDTSPGTLARPFATLAQAREAVRVAKAQPGAGAIRVVLRGGTYYLPEPLVLTPADSGTADRPVVYAAYPGEKPILSGGVPVTGWKKAEGQLWTAQVPQLIGDSPAMHEFILAGERQTRARTPNVGANPYESGFLSVRSPKTWAGGFGACVGSIHNQGDFLEYELDLPAEGDYFYWLYYGAFNKPFGNADMADRTQITVDGGDPIPLKNLPDTGDWGKFAWSQCAKVHFTAGKHTLRWTNVKGGGLNLDAFLLCDDPAFTPQGTDNLTAPPGKHLLVQQSEAFTKSQGKSMTVDGFVDKTGKLLYFDAGALHAWPNSPDKLLHIFIYESGICSNTVVPITSIDEAQSLITVPQRIGGDRAEVGARFFVDNVREALDSPAEWYLDRRTGALTCWPQTGRIGAPPPSISRLNRLIELQSKPDEPPVQYVRFEGLTLECTDCDLPVQDWYHSDCAAVWFRAAQHCTITGCTFRNLGASGVVLVGNCTDNAVTGCEFAYLGAGGGTLNGSPKNQHLDVPAAGKPAARNLISGNRIHHTGLTLKHGNPICLNSAEDNIISHNSIAEHPRQGIVLTEACGGNVIEYNEIRRSSLETGDTGGIYTYDTNKLPTPNIIRGNLVVDTRGMTTDQTGKIITPSYSWGIYIDGESSNWIVRDNIVSGNVLGGVFINGGHNNVIENNILMNSQQGQLAYSDYAQHGIGNVFKHNIVVWSDPAAKLLWSGDWMKDAAHIDADFNLYWHKGLDIPEFADLQKHSLDAHSLVADPLFMDAAHEDFRLKPDSPALKLGFKAIDVSMIGSKGYVLPK